MSKPTEAFSDPRVEAVRRWLLKYQPFITTVVAILLIAVFLPGRSSDTSTDEISDVAGGVPEFSQAPTFGSGDDPDTTEGPGETTTTSGPQEQAPQVQPNVLTFEEAQEQGAELVANCDPETGRIKMPTNFAPVCVQAFNGTNAGQTWQGVNEEEIVVAYYEAEANPAADAILAAAGAEDSDEEVRQQVQEWGELYEAHHNTWGRKVRWEFVPASGDAEDDAAAKSDAIYIDEELNAFAAVNSPNNTFVNELVARGVMCFCTVSQPIEAYQKWEPFVWSSLMASSQGYVHRAEMVGKRLAGHNAQYAWDDIDPDPTRNFTEMERNFGFLYYETEDFAYKAGAEFFLQHLKDRWNVTIPREQVAAYNGFPDIAATQEQARPIIQKMKEADVTSIIFSGDPFGPIFFTQEATRQLYGPEWIITGSALTDTSFFARTYDQDQWEHAFGLSFLTARVPEEFSGDFRVYRWHYDKEPTARAGYGVIDAPINILYNGLHMAGPNLTPEAFKNGLYSAPITGHGGIIDAAQSYGDKGLWPWKTDTLTLDDITYIWWDRDAEGEDEIGQDGQGLYRYVDMGQRFLPTEHPNTPIPVWDEKNTVTIYEEPPPQDQWPCYESPATGKKDRC